eukprot:SAG31_NODE_13284_length_879_cov_2.683333_1_plen_256_part_10
MCPARIQDSSHCEYMALERNTRTTAWLRALLQSMQIFRATGLPAGTMNFGKLCRLFNETSLYRDASSKCDLKWIVRHNGMECMEAHGETGMGKWAIITELGTGDILAIAAGVSPPHQHGPAADTTWIVPRHDENDATPHPQIHVFDAFGFAAFVEMATVVIGDNITALKWASVDAVTPKNKHIRTIYHWLREHIRDGSIDLRDCPTQDNLADCLTKPIVGPPAQRISDAISGYGETAPIPPRLAYIKLCNVVPTAS